MSYATKLKDKFAALGPKFLNVNKSCKILGYYNDEPVLIRNNKHLVSSFHPEISQDLCLYKYFLKMINE